MVTTPRPGRMHTINRTDLDDLYAILDGIRETGKVNMMGAAPHLMSIANEGLQGMEKHGALTTKESRDVLAAWMEDVK